MTVDPAVLSGTPCVAGTRLPVYLIAHMVWREGVESAMEMWDLSRPQVLVACWFAGAYGTVELWEVPEDWDAPSPDAYRTDLTDRTWLDRWRAWAQASAGALWRMEYEAVTDPPLEGAWAVGNA